MTKLTKDFVLSSEDVAVLRRALRLLESNEVQIDGEWGSCRTLEVIEAEGDLSREIVDLRALIAQIDR